MIGLMQRVNWAQVRVDDTETGRIDRGLLVLIGVERGDTAAEADRLVERLLGFRVFSDDAGRMNASVTDTGGGLLLVPQFTLPADTRKGTRPSFTPAAPPPLGEALFDRVVDTAHASGLTVQTGVFGADMKVALENDGPVTFWLQVSPPG
ncbi:MAG: D-aminoacyl-tRNA deacylase [Pseudomonadota bacterium]